MYILSTATTQAPKTPKDYIFVNVNLAISSSRRMALQDEFAGVFPMKRHAQDQELHKLQIVTLILYIYIYIYMVQCHKQTIVYMKRNVRTTDYSVCSPMTENVQL